MIQEGIKVRWCRETGKLLYSQLVSISTQVNRKILFAIFNKIGFLRCPLTLKPVTFAQKLIWQLHDSNLPLEVAFSEIVNSKYWSKRLFFMRKSKPWTEWAFFHIYLFTRSWPKNTNFFNKLLALSPHLLNGNGSNYVTGKVWLNEQ